jgi:hypothetical protein
MPETIPQRRASSSFHWDPLRAWNVLEHSVDRNAWKNGVQTAENAWQTPGKTQPDSLRNKTAFLLKKWFQEDRAVWLYG